MPKRTNKTTGSELFIVDNSSEDWKVLRYLRDWCPLSRSIDIATGYFEIGSLLGLGDAWQAVDKICILMGDEVSRRTLKAFEKGLAGISTKLDDSIEGEKSFNHFLTGVPAIVEAIRSGKIECRVYRKDKFHAKAYITHARLDVIGSYALVGSSNMTFPGLTENIELNVQIAGPPVSVLQDWYAQHWAEAEDVTPEILRVIERHTRLFLPFEIYARSLQQYFLAHEETASEWEENKSIIYPVLARYQRDGYHALLKRSSRYGGSFLCDGVGLGKTFIGLMLIERFVSHENKNVALFVPKAARFAVWEKELDQRLPGILKGYSRLKVFSHTDLGGDRRAEELEQVRKQADIVIIDEAHHFRNTGTKGEKNGEKRSRYWRLFDLLEGKQVFHLTATPINNSLGDFRHMVELFSRGREDYFSSAPLGIHSLSGHIRKLDRAIEAEIFGMEDSASDELGRVGGGEILSSDLLSQDSLFDALVVQRSRSYVKESMRREGGGEVLFPTPRAPQTIEYSVKQTYGKLLDMVSGAFHRRDPLFALPVYYPYAFYTGDDASIDLELEKGRRKQVVSLIRTNFLKRLESSVESFRQSCWNLLWKLLAWLEVNAQTEAEKADLLHWKRRKATLLGVEPDRDLFDEEAEEDLIAPEIFDTIERLSRDEFDVGKIIHETLKDLEQLADFLQELEKFKPSQDKKLKALLKMLHTDKVLSQHKVLIFTEFKDTARYLYKQLKEAGIEGVEVIDSGYKGDRLTLIRRFAPYYNGTTSQQLAESGESEIRVLISTDVLSEGLNLQDATRLINYDLHWNPVRLMQRIGRIDRRMNAGIEAQIKADHPDQKELRGTTAYWNFLPPEDLDQLLRLYQRVSNKTLRISKTLGIEGKRLLREDDDYEDLRNFTEQYEGQKTPDEKMHLEYQQIISDDPDLEARLAKLPNGIFSGKENLDPGTRAVFFCYARPACDKPQGETSGQAHNEIDSADCWTTAAGDVRWYLYDIASGTIEEDGPKIVRTIRCSPDTPRRAITEQTTLSQIREKIEKHIKRTYLRKVQAPAGVSATLKAWMELN